MSVSSHVNIVLYFIFKMSIQNRNTVHNVFLMSPGSDSTL